MSASTPSRPRRALAVFGESLRLGCTAFGGPVAHLAFFERRYVRARAWLSHEDYAGLVALCQTLPGPGSSQLSFLVGLHRAGALGALAAFVGFTLPAACLMFAFALLAPHLDGPRAQAAVHGLKLVAVIVVAQAVLAMARRLCPDALRRLLALAAALVLLLSGGTSMQLAALAGGALAGLLWCRELPQPAAPAFVAAGARASVLALVLFTLPLLALPLLARAYPGSLAALPAPFYRAGALVFGGGHVVLPLLRDALVPAGWLGDDAFLTGYGLAQAIPGPLFSFSAYLGARIAPPGAEAAWAALALLSLFAPGLLLALAAAPLWSSLLRRRRAHGAMAGVNAAVVGVLAAALYDPVWTSAVRGLGDVAIVLAGFAALQWGRLPVPALLAACVLTSLLVS